MSKLYLVWPDGDKCEICTLPFHKWLKIKNYNLETNNSWENYKLYLEENDLHLISDFSLSTSDAWLELGDD